MGDSISLKYYFFPYWSINFNAIPIKLPQGILQNFTSWKSYGEEKTIWWLRRCASMKTNEVILTLRKHGICPKEKKKTNDLEEKARVGGKTHVYKMSLQINGKVWLVKCMSLQLRLSICKNKGTTYSNPTSWTG